jgi:hypothetical protein
MNFFQFAKNTKFKSSVYVVVGLCNFSGPRFGGIEANVS